MKKIYIILYVLILVVIPVYATRYFSYKFKDDITVICPDCDYFISCNSDSMSPTFDCDDVLIAVQPRSAKDIEVGDIIWYRGKEKDVVHRITRKDYKNCYITKGDNTDYEDDFTPCFYDIKFKIKGVIYE